MVDAKLDDDFSKLDGFEVLLGCRSESGGGGGKRRIGELVTLRGAVDFCGRGGAVVGMWVEWEEGKLWRKMLSDEASLRLATPIAKEGREWVDRIDISVISMFS